MPTQAQIIQWLTDNPSASVADIRKAAQATNVNVKDVMEAWKTLQKNTGYGAAKARRAQGLKVAAALAPTAGTAYRGAKEAGLLSGNLGSDSVALGAAFGPGSSGGYSWTNRVQRAIDPYLGLGVVDGVQHAWDPTGTSHGPVGQNSVQPGSLRNLTYGSAGTLRSLPGGYGQLAMAGKIEAPQMRYGQNAPVLGRGGSAGSGLVSRTTPSRGGLLGGAGQPPRAPGPQQQQPSAPPQSAMGNQFIPPNTGTHTTEGVPAWLLQYGTPLPGGMPWITTPLYGGYNFGGFR